MKKVIKKVVAKAPVKKTVAKKPMMQPGGIFKRTKEDINIKSKPNPEFPGYGTASDGYKTSRTNPITGKVVEKSKVTNSENDPDYGNKKVNDIRTRTVKDKEGTIIKQKTKTFDIERRDIAKNPFYGGDSNKANKAFNKYNQNRIKPLYSVDKKTVVKTKNGEGIEKTNSYLGREKLISLSKDKPKGYSGKERKKVSVPVQKTGGATKAAYKKGGAVKVTAKKVMMKKDGGNIDDPKSATPQQPKVYSSKKEFRKDLKNAKMNAKVEAAKSGQSKDWSGKATAAAGAGTAILGLVEGAKRLFEKKPSEKNGGYMKKGGVVKKATAKKTIVKSKKK